MSFLVATNVVASLPTDWNAARSCQKFNRMLGKQPPPPPSQPPPPTIQNHKPSKKQSLPIEPNNQHPPTRSLTNPHTGRKLSTSMIEKFNSMLANRKPAPGPTITLNHLTPRPTIQETKKIIQTSRVNNDSKIPDNETKQTEKTEDKRKLKKNGLDT